MKKKFTFIKGILAFAILALTFSACDKDYATLGADIVGGNNYSTSRVEYPIVTYNSKINSVQTNGLSSYFLGIYDDPIYGKSSANIVSQLTLSNRTTGVNINLDSVVVSIPYYSHINSDDPLDDNGYTNYILDSIYGNVDELGNSLATMKLSIFRNNYFLRDYDPETDFVEAQRYYSDRSTGDGSMIPLTELESELIFENQSENLFQFKSDQIVFSEENDEGEMEEIQRTQPSLVLVFNQEGEGQGNYLYSDNLQFWQESLIDKMEDEELSNANNFKNYFRGLYFKLEEVSGNGAKGLLNISTGSITLHYNSISDSDTDGDGIPNTYDIDYDGDGEDDEGKVDTDGDGVVDEADIDQTFGTDENNDGLDDEVANYIPKTVTLSFSGNVINFYENNFEIGIVSEIENADPINGDDKLYLKGGQGSVAIVDLFNPEDLDDDGVSDALQVLKSEYVDGQGNKIRLINEANLVFYEDESITGDEHDFDRLYVYDLENDRPLVDYSQDIASSTSPEISIPSHLGLRTENDLGEKMFKIRITEHLKNLIYKDSTNTKLGLSISSNVNAASNAAVLNPIDDILKTVPRGTVLSQRGTIIYGNNTALENKKVKLVIHYTEPNSETE